MTNRDIYPCYVKIVDHLESDDVMELPSNESGSMYLSTIQAQYPNATGLRFKYGSAWSEIRLDDGVLYPPENGWGEKEFFIIFPKGSGKRKLDSNFSQGPDAKVVRQRTDKAMLEDLIVLGLTYSATEDDLKSYFEQFGELDLHQIKFDHSGKSKGFGFIRYKSADVARKVLKEIHVIAGRRCEVRLPKSKEDAPLKLFVGRLKEGTTTDHLVSHFSKYGEVKDAYIPKNFRGFGFITLQSQEAARQVLEESHLIEGSCVNVTYAEQKDGKYSQVNSHWGNFFDKQQAPGFDNQLSSGYNNQQQQPGYNKQQPPLSERYWF